MSAPIYEVTLFINRDTVADVDAWLEKHIRRALRNAAVADCYVVEMAEDDTGRLSRVCQHVLEADEALNDFIDNDAEEIEADIAALFGDQVEVRGRVLREDPLVDIPTDESPYCLNCGAQLRGQYCGYCGQRSRSRLISLWELISDAFGDMFELDSRLWRTLGPLLRRPGLLTADYLQGKRVRYMPPFRMYLVLSLIFFLVAFFNPREELGILYEPQTEAELAAIEEEQADALREEIAEQLESIPEGTLTEEELAEIAEITERIDEGPEVRITDASGEVGDDCDVDLGTMEEDWPWLAKRVTPDRVQALCERIQEDGWRWLAKEIIEDTPVALILLLPLMAFVLKVLYPLSRRFYVEHLLFFVHFHSFFFLMLILTVVYSRVGGWIRLPEVAVVLPIVVAGLYIPVYLFLAMRRVYGQGRLVTFLKYIALLAAYLFGSFMLMFGTFMVAAFSG